MEGSSSSLLLAQPPQTFLRKHPLLSRGLLLYSSVNSRKVSGFLLNKLLKFPWKTKSYIKWIETIYTSRSKFGVDVTWSQLVLMARVSGSLYKEAQHQEQTCCTNPTSGSLRTQKLDHIPEPCLEPLDTFFSPLKVTWRSLWLLFRCFQGHSDQSHDSPPENAINN